MSACNCIDHDPLECLAKKASASLSLVGCLGGCECRCHKTKRGITLTNEQWRANRERMVRPVRPARDEITDPRIQALMPQEGMQHADR